MRKYFYYCLFLFIITYGCGKSAIADLTNPGDIGTTDPGSGTSGFANIVILGSSTAAGKGATPSDSAWVNRLRLATLDNKKSLYYINLAAIGYTTYQGMPAGYATDDKAADTTRNITKAFFYKPSLVIITYPTNDVALGYTDDEIMRNYAEMVRLLDSAKVTYIMLGTQPRDFTDVALRTRLKSLNDKIKTTYSIHFNDIYDSLSTADLYIKPAYSFGDGIHLNNAGHNVILTSVLGNTIFKNIIK
jgi:lysophospholipase L1-like esterase